MFKRFIRILSFVLIISLLWNMLPVSVLGAELRAAQDEADTPVALESGIIEETEQPEDIIIIGELTDRRTENIKEYLLSNGNTLAAVYGTPVHYQKDGQWKDIDNTLTAKADGTYVNTAGAWDVSFPQTLSSANHITITKDGYTLSFGMAGQLWQGNAVIRAGENVLYATEAGNVPTLTVSAASISQAQIQQVDLTQAKAAAKHPQLVQEKLASRLAYSQIYANTDIVYDLDSNRVKESIILSQYDSTLQGYRYTLNTGGMIPVLGDDGHIDFYDAQGEEIVMTMPAPFLVDANFKYNWDVEVTLTGSGNTYTLTYTLPQQWLAAEDRAWPVVLDPVVQAGSSATTIADQTVFSYGSEDYRWEYLLCGRDASDIDEVISRFYLKFTDLPALTSADVVVDAEVALYCVENDLSPFYVGVHSVTGSWSSSGITWSNKPGYNTKAADFVLLGNRGTYRWNITDIVREWYQINENPNNNFGMMFKASVAEESLYGSNEYALFYSSDSSINKPQLTIEYRNTTGLEDYWDYTSASAGRAGTAYINNGAGNLVFVRNLMAFGGNRMPVSIDLVYNASDKGSNSYGVGNGWRTNYHQRVYQPSGTDYYVWEDADGTRHYFNYSSVDGFYHDEDNLDLKLSVSNGIKTITDLAGNSSTFDANGRLTKLTNNQATKSSINITYTTGNLISQITDGVGRVYSFVYANGRLSRLSYKATGTTELHYVELLYDTGNNLTGTFDRDEQSCAYTYSNNLLITASDPHGIGLTFNYYNTAANGANRIFKIKEHQKTVVNGVDSYEYGNCIEFTYSNKWTTLTDAQGNVQNMLFNIHGNTITVQDDKGAAVVAKYATDESTDGQKHQLTLFSDLRSPSVNWFINGGFEGTGGYTVSNARDYHVMNSDLSGKALYVKAQSQITSDVIFDSILLESGESCTFSAYIKLSGGEATLQLYNIILRSESMTLTTAYQNQWVRLSTSYTNNTNEAMRIVPYIHLDTSTDVYIDCVQLEKTVAPSPLNLLQNSDFAVAKTNTNYGWTESGLRAGDGRANITTSVAPAMDGNVIRLTGAATLQKRVNQQVNISGAEGDVLTLAGWGKGYVPKNGATHYGQRQFGLQLTFYNNGGIVGTGKTFLFSPNTEGWQYVAGQAVAPADYTYVVVTLLLDYNVNTVYFDGIQLCREGLGDEYTYNQNGDVATVTNSKGQKATFSYTNRDLRSIVNFDGSIIEYTYDAYKNITQEVTTYLSDDVDGDPVEYTTTYTYDTYGNVKTTSTTGMGTANITYTDNGNYLQTYKDEKDNLTTYNYNQDTGMLISVTDPSGTGTSYGYDSRYRYIGSIQDGTNTSFVAHSYGGDLLSHIMTGSTHYYFTYGDFGVTEQVKAGTNILATYSYTDRELTSILYGNGAEVTYVYDNEGRVVEECYPGNTEDIIVKYGYDGVGRLVSVTDGFTNRTTNYSYDAEGNLLCAETRQGNTTVQSIRYRYDEYDQLVGKTTDLSASVTLVEAYAYNAQHRIDEVASNGFLQHAEYNNSGLLSNTTIQFGNTDRVTQQYTYGSMTELSEYGVSYGAKANIYKYEYDSRGNITQITIHSTTSYDEKIIKYTYDTANQLIREDNELTNRAWIMTYDDAGNMTRREEYLYVNGELGRLLSTQTFTYGKNGWGDVLTGINGTTVASDAIGNITNDGTWTFTWKNGRQLAAMENDSERWDFSYDASGMRTQRSNGNTTYKYTYEGTTLTQMTVGSNTLIFAYGVNGHPMGVKYNGTSYYYVTNAFGDVLAILDDEGAEVVAYSYDAWGNILSTSGSMASTLGAYNPLRYRSYVFDQETGLYYLQSRYYNPAICRFISADSISYLGADGTPVSYNLFAYCNNNPVMYSDPTGNLPSWVTKFLVGTAVIAGAAILFVATAGTGTALACFAVGALKGAAIGAAVGAASGAATGAITHRITTGSWDGAGLAALEGAADGYMMGAITGFISGGLTSDVCFVAGTTVLASTGYVAIETIEAGDYVWASDPETGEVALKQVVQTFVNKATELIHVTVKDEEIICTTEHPFYSPVKGWTAACKLRAGDILVTVNGEYVVVEKVQHEILETPVKVYNFEVEGFHTYYVSGISVLVHNVCSKTSGSYEIFTADNRVYVGKGSLARMQSSIRRLQKQGFLVTDSLWESARNSSTAFVNEYMKMAKYNFDFGGVLINKIMSPGFKIFSMWL